MQECVYKKLFAKYPELMFEYCDDIVNADDISDTLFRCAIPQSWVARLPKHEFKEWHEFGIMPVEYWLVLLEDLHFDLIASFFENGRLSFVTSSSVSIYDENYAIRDRIGFVGEMSAISADTDGTVLAIKNGALNGRNRIIAFNDEAELIFDDSVLFGVEGVGIRGEYVFIKSDSGAVRLSTANGDTEYHECHNGKMLVYDDSTVIVCGDSSAVYVKFENN